MIIKLEIGAETSSKIEMIFLYQKKLSLSGYHFLFTTTIHQELYQSAEIR